MANFDWSSMIAAVVGGALTGGVTLLANRQIHSYNVRLHQLQQQNRIRGVLNSIRYELEILGKTYAEQAGGLLNQTANQTTFDIHFSLTEKYFIVYPNNTELVATLHRLEQGTQNVTLKTLEQITIRLKCSIGDIFS